MIKKIIISIIFVCFLEACGKKGDPEYTNTTKKTEKLTELKIRL
tara:strand:- start:406 stop:537 length:132 start_codon:yes stop_codon:yes gene_type:complete